MGTKAKLEFIQSEKPLYRPSFYLSHAYRDSGPTVPLSITDSVTSHTDVAESVQVCMRGAFSAQTRPRQNLWTSAFCVRSIDSGMLRMQLWPSRTVQPAPSRGCGPASRFQLHVHELDSSFRCTSRRYRSTHARRTASCMIRRLTTSGRQSQARRGSCRGTNTLTRGGLGLIGLAGPAELRLSS